MTDADSAAYFIGRSVADLQAPYHAEDCVFGSVRLDKQHIVGGDFAHCTFANISLKQALVKDTRFLDCVFIDCYFRRAEITSSRFIGCRFVDCNFSHIAIKSCDFKHSSFAAASYRSQRFFIACHRNRIFVRSLPGASTLRRVNLDCLAMRGGIVWRRSGLAKPTTGQRSSANLAGTKNTLIRLLA